MIGGIKKAKHDFRGMRIDTVRLEELKTGHNRASRAVYIAIKNGKPLTVEDLFPFVKQSYFTGKHRSNSHIKHMIRNALEWLTY